MIVDKIKNFEQYTQLWERGQKAFEFLKKAYDENYADGKYIIDGDNVFVNISSYETKDENTIEFENHKKYIDIQFVLDGCEIIYVDDPDDLEMTKDFEDGGDIAFYKGEAKTRLVLESGDFVVLYPQDAHKPCCQCPNNKNVKKAVVKVLI